MRKHAAANDDLRTVGTMEGPIRAAAGREWADCVNVGERNDWRNAQARLLAPTGCLTGDTMDTTDGGPDRLSELGDVHGPKWQELSARVSTDDGPRQATKFFVNGEEPTRSIVTEGGHRLQGTYTHRIKIVDQETGAWEWKRFADITEGDVVPMQLGTMSSYELKWPDLAARVSTDDGPRQATKFFVNGEEPTRIIVTEGGHRLQGTYTHRIKIVDQETGAWEWKRFADITEGDVVPMQLGTMVGEIGRASCREGE